ncbi:MAG TPA: PEP/pyruvate-binding domain-containing protein, partial [Flavisolibacter sp.]
MPVYTRKFRDISIADVPDVGGKNASLGEMFSQLQMKGIRVPDGFATTSAAFWKFIDTNSLRPRLEQLMQSLDRQRYTNLAATGMLARQLLMQAEMPAEVVSDIINAYREFSAGRNIAVAVRSSATAEDLPQASFAGQHESFLNIRGEKALLEAVRRCFASLYTDRAIKYREDNGFEHEKVALSVGIQEMVRSDTSSSGVAFTLEPESGFRDVIHISGVWGLGENLVQGTVTPDEFLVFKPSLKNNDDAI